IGTICDTIIAGARVAVEPCGCRFFVPDAFSPNGDGMNDRFAIKYHCDSVTFQLQILNRWGQVIYRQTEADPFWDGRHQGQPAPEGVYLYRLVFKGGSGEHFREEERHGRLVLIR
ncbi:MAG: gliding motility-associated C-terminal domain-containing protein, partial [Schleiferiaceae bacterium]|nr:gliding motility-associated C-terminal domain-containing protein [Schleiferiaceae bacterium]